MGIGEIPRLPAKRRVLVMVDEHELERLEYEGGAKVLFDNESCVVNVEDPPSSTIIDDLEGMNLLAPGQVLVQNPYLPDRYVPLVTATADIATSKHHLFTEFCFLLGAKSVAIEQLEEISGAETKVFKAKAGGWGTSGKLSAEHEQTKRLAQQLKVNASYSGGEPDLEAAEQFLRRHRLLGDQHLESLLGMRRHKGNSVLEHKVNISLTDEARTNLKVAAKLSTPAFSFSADIERATSQNVEFRLALKVTF